MTTIFEIEPKFDGLLRAHGLASFDAMMKVRGGVATSSHAHRETVPVELAEGDGIKRFFLKRVNKVPAAHAIGPLLRGRAGISQPRNEWNILEKLNQAGVPAMGRVAYGERRRWNCPVSAFLLVEAVPMEFTLEDWLVPGGGTAPRLSGRSRRRLFFGIGRLLGRLQAAGFFWPDLRLKHIFAGQSDGEWKLQLIDVERMELRGPSGAELRSGMKALARIRERYTPFSMTRMELRTFAAGYRKAAGDLLVGIAGEGERFVEYCRQNDQRPRMSDSLIYPRRQSIAKVDGCYADERFIGPLRNLGLAGKKAIFECDLTDRLDKKGLKPHRDRARVQVSMPDGSARVLYLKRFRQPPMIDQLRRAIESRVTRGSSYREFHFVKRLWDLGISTMNCVAYGQDMAGLWERRSFLMTEEVAGESLEKLCNRIGRGEATIGSKKERDDVIEQLAFTVARMHRAKIFHRDLYLSHVFLAKDNSGDALIHLIDLGRMIENPLRPVRWRIKDLAALEHSSPAGVVTRTDRIRFLHLYLGTRRGVCKRSGRANSTEGIHGLRYYIRAVRGRADRMRRHDLHKGRSGIPT